MNDSVWQNLNKEEQSNIQKENDNIENSAETETEEDKQNHVENESLGVTVFDFMKMFVALAFVLALVYFLLKFVTKRNRFINQGQAIVNLGGTSLGQNKSIQMVKVGERVLVVGVGESISLLKEIDDEHERIEFIKSHELKQEQMVAPKDLMKKVTTMLNANHNRQNHSQKTKSIPFSKAFNEQLENLKKERTKQLDDVKRRGLDKNE
ncbi:flagellar biosynthetic protein FliO [Metabacillus malikii]|uniref:Flagellar protein FliO/FliZ n=1 Tax=Metabacillus malikii TaxID=1504265 RepID=A0ABT9ZE45_9BACI|nr:flagellar biosynthetic protein FliO [Metabacillus malikii]MDQ0230522.1 flagellar protein FliO/FliZ [Metabacillus malikii]